MPVAATPAPMTTVPLRSSQSRTRVARPDLLGMTGSPSRPRVRSVNGSRKAGRNSETARMMWLAQDDREERAEVHGPGRSTSSATHSVSSVRSTIRSPAAANARRTSGSRSTWMPDASRRPPLPGRPSPGRIAARQLGGKVDEQARDEVREDEVERPAVDRQAASRDVDPDVVARGVRRGGLDRDRIGVDAADRAGAHQRGPDREDARSPVPTSRTVAPSTSPSSAQRSRPARQSRVVGCSPVPKAMPGSSADDDLARGRDVLAPRRADDDRAVRRAGPGSAPSRRSPSPPRGRPRPPARRSAAGRRPGDARGAPGSRVPPDRQRARSCAGR